MLKKIFFLLLVSGFIFPSQVFSDVVEEGETTVLFKIVNLAEYPDYQFYYYYKTYYYDQGYHTGEPTLTWIEEGKEYEGGSKRSSSVIMARLKSDTTQIFETEKSYGGSEIVNGKNVDRLVDEIRIKSIEGELIKVKSKRYEVRENGDRIETEGWFFGGLYGGPFQFFGINGLILLMPLGAFLSLFIFFLWRKNISRKQDASLVA